MRRATLAAILLIAGCKPSADDMWEKAAAALPGEIAKAKALGMPLELKDIGLPMNVPDKDNAAPLYRKAIAEYEEISPDELHAIHLAIAQAPIKPVDRKTMAVMVNRIRPILDIAIEGATRPACDFKRQWTKGYAVLFPEYGPLRGIVKHLTADAVLDAKTGRLESCLSKLRTSMQIGAHIGNEPMLIPLLVQLACEAITAARLQCVISIYASDGPALARIEKLIREFPPMPTIRRALAGELVLSRQTIKNMKTSRDLDALSRELGGIDFTLPPEGPEMRLFCDASEARLIEWWNKAYPILQGDTSINLGKRLDELESELGSHGNDGSYIMTAMLVPVFGGASTALARGEAQRLLTSVKVDLLQFKLAKGRFPRSLDELGKVPLDPLDGKPLRYKVQNGGFVLYSIGKNQKDDKGFRDSQNGDDVVEHPYDRTKYGPKRTPARSESPPVDLR